jgi:hypothetical protein
MKIGDVLHNGATVLQFSDNAILATWGSKVTPFVTWRYFEGDPRSTSWGHYFSNLEDAVKDYEERK